MGARCFGRVDCGRRPVHAGIGANYAGQSGNRDVADARADADGRTIADLADYTDGRTRYIAPMVIEDKANIIGVTQSPFVGITLQDAVAMALMKNPNLAISASNARISAYQVVEARGAFDVKLQVQPTSNYNVQPPLNPFEAGPGSEGQYLNQNYPGPNETKYLYTPGPGDVIQHQSTFTYGLGGQSLNGTQYQAGIEQQRVFNNTVLNSFNPYYVASLNLSVIQPLLRNLGMNAPKHQLLLAQVSADSSAQSALVNASDTISQVSNSYWNLVAAWRNVAIQEEALKDAVTQQHSIVRLAKRGATAPIDATEAATQVAAFQDDVYSALQTVAELQNQLKGLIVTDANDKIWQANLLPTSQVEQLPRRSNPRDGRADGGSQSPGDTTGLGQIQTGRHRF